MADTGLTNGAIKLVSEDKGENLRPVLQVTELRLVGTQQERFRMLLSDGVHCQQAMLATQMNDLVKSNAILKGSIVQLNEFICNTIQNRRIIIVINLEVLVKTSDIIGEPRLYAHDASAQPQMPPANRPGPPPSGQNYSPGQPPTNAPYAGSFGGASNPGRNAGNLGAHNVRPEQSMGGFNAQANANNRSHVGGYQHTGSNYPRPAQSMHMQPPVYANRGPIAKNEAPPRIIPIAALNPYQGRWTIKARVTGKADMKRYNNPRGEGKVFSFDLLDSDGGEIRITCFNAVVDQFFDLIEVGRVYLISKGTLKPAQKNFNHLNNEYEIVLDGTSTIEPCLQDDSTIPRQQFNFRPICEIEGMVNNSMVDLIGLVSSISPAGTILRKNGTETLKRTLQLKDMSGRSVEVTLWGSFCSSEGQQLQAMCDSGLSPVLALKAGRVSDFSGKSVGTITSSQVFVDPDFPESQKLKEWYNREGKNMTVVSLSIFSGRTDSRKTVSQIKDEGLGRSEKPDWITVKAIISFIKVDNFCYTACPLMVGDKQCNKKVTNNGDGTWRCDKCDQTFPECDYRYLLNFQIQDHTGVTWVTAFQESGEEIMGVSAKELYLLKCEQHDEVGFTEVIRGVLFNQHLFKLKIKEETFSDEQRVKSTVVKAEKVNALSESTYLFGLIEKLSHVDSSGGPGVDTNIASGSGMQNAGQFSPHSHGSSFGAKPGSEYSRVGYGNSFGQQVNTYGNPMNSNAGTWGGQSFGGGDSSIPNFAAGNAGNDSNVCFKCKKPGHWSRDCPGLNASPYVNANVPNYTKQYVGGF